MIYLFEYLLSKTFDKSRDDWEISFLNSFNTNESKILYNFRSVRLLMLF